MKLLRDAKPIKWDVKYTLELTPEEIKHLRDILYITAFSHHTYHTPEGIVERLKEHHYRAETYMYALDEFLTSWTHGE